jgi:hypothetical protein
MLDNALLLLLQFVVVMAARGAQLKSKQRNFLT